MKYRFSIRGVTTICSLGSIQRWVARSSREMERKSTCVFRTYSQLKWGRSTLPTHQSDALLSQAKHHYDID